MAMTLRPSPEQDALIESLAQSEGVSKHEVVLRAIEEKAERNGHITDRKRFTAEAQAQFQDVIRRLGE